MNLKNLTKECRDSLLNSIETILDAKVYHENEVKKMRLSAVMCELNCKCDYILTAEQGHRVIKCLKCGNVKPI
jgi:hypothetical protein